jgi:TATA-binding protein-associated factor
MVDLGLAKLNAVVPVTKVVKNLCAFLCSDPTQTPCFDPTSGLSKGILSFRIAASPASGEKGESTETAEMSTAYISRRGAELALAQLSRRFGSQLFERVPMIWQSTTDGLSLACQGGQLEDVDKRLEKQVGQDVIDSLITIQTVVPAMHSELWPKVVELLPSILLTLRSRFAVVRQTAARCLSTICDVVTAEAMRYTIEEVLPLLGNSKSVTDRQGAIEAVFRKSSSYAAFRCSDSCIMKILWLVWMSRLFHTLFFSLFQCSEE